MFTYGSVLKVCESTIIVAPHCVRDSIYASVTTGVMLLPLVVRTFLTSKSTSAGFVLMVTGVIAERRIEVLEPVIKPLAT